ncbi:ATP-dependent helicase Lhr and Lhr-like helicase [Thiohalospira halophila DSM 15071]|uniref:ATP-dependent helicase Lhr and Lhr-like helicase n=1 Tax=Thiohalospira halophila DSM 15071 TaxID=1123397 RepID=A0A1I1VB46_9GAMM|nr:DEAD/DEAH box helicase [Thiohalospira halophila]SFD80321.1 ATP-dependent helicase Lhr and Lhr-like helicase [Thiohalospira halophila DSM 15071]
MTPGADEEGRGPIANPATVGDPVGVFHPVTGQWFRSAFGTPTPVQARGWPAIGAGEHALLVAPTGSGKTLAAFLAAIDRISHQPAAEAGVRALYISPLKALVHDVERNLRNPVSGIARTAEARGETATPPTVGIRTGDTPQAERERQRRRPPEILVTTPESLFLILGSRAAANLATVETIIVDEVHALAGTKRGAHLALSLERVAALAHGDPQRIGLSATVNPPETAARFLAGDRPVTTVDASEPPQIRLTVSVPVPDMENPPPPPAEDPDAGGPILGEAHRRAAGPSPGEQGIWQALYPRLVALVREHTATIIFVNSRGLCERLAQRLNEQAEATGDEPLVRAHHGSLDHERRAAVEEALKAGTLRGIVATSSLELGIDMGAVDQVVMVESPGTVASGLQRVGRAGHGVGEASHGTILPKHRGDLLHAGVVAERMLAGAIETVRIPENPLDVLAQQVVATAAAGDTRRADLLALARRAAPYRQLPEAALDGVLEMLSGGYPSSTLADLRPLLAWDRTADAVTARRGAAMRVRLNGGTIPDRGAYPVHIAPDGPRVGELDEEMVHETRAGENIALGASTWRVAEVTRDRVLVTPAPGEPGKLPFWRGDGPGRPVELGRALGAFTRELAAADDIAAAVSERVPTDAGAAANLAAYLREQVEATGDVPSDRTIVVERFRDELGDWRIAVLSPFGARIHAPWALALRQRLADYTGAETQILHTDDGITLRLADGDELPPVETLFPEPEAVEEQVTEVLADTSLFAALFRENAGRSLLIPRRGGKSRTPLWQQRLKAQSLLAEVRRYPAFPLVLETYRQALADHFDLAGLTEVLAHVRDRRIRVRNAETDHPSPFARSLVFAFVAAFLYEEDTPLAERRAQALTLDRGLLAELVGQAELRDLLDADAVAAVEARLAHTDPDHRARDADELHDLLRRLGDLTGAEAAERATGDAAAWLADLQRQRRAHAATIAGEPRWIATADAGLYRDALGVPAPSGLPESALAPVERPLERLLARYARHHGPFTTAEVAARYGLTAGQVEPVLQGLAGAGQLLHGAIRPAGSGEEWVDTEVLRRLKRESVGRLRQEAAAVDGATLAAFLPGWQGVGEAGTLEEAIASLEGIALPWSLWTTAILPARVRGFSLDELERLTAGGEVVWVGAGSLGTSDGRVRLLFRENAARLLEPEAAAGDPADSEDPVAAALLAELDRRGAVFYTDLESAVARRLGDVAPEAFRTALWDLVWAGRITNDTLAPLRGLGGRGRKRTHRTAGGRWTRVAELADPRITAEDRALARAGMLLRRYGIAGRTAAGAEGLPGGFGPVYTALGSLEEAGRVRRGHFVEGLSGAQFAWPGAVDRLRAHRDEAEEGNGPARLLPAADPANAWGQLLPWPAVSPGGSRPRRGAGDWVVTVAGHPVLFVGGGGKRITTFDEATGDGEALEAAAAALAGLTGRGRLLTVERIDGEPARESGHAPAFRSAGFSPDYRGLVWESSPR